MTSGLLLARLAYSEQGFTLKEKEWGLGEGEAKSCIAITSLGEERAILVLFVRLFDLCLFGFVGFLFFLVSGRGCGLWLWHSLDVSLTFLFTYF